MSVKVVTVGARGYATAYTRPLLDEIKSGKYEYAGVIARDITVCPYADEFEANKIPVYPTLEAFFAENTADLVVISTPPQFHAQQSIYSVEHGANVMCEKPIAPDYESAVKMVEASERTGKFIGIGYQHSYSNAIINLKKDILNGVLGKAVSLKTMVLWPRGWEYYSRGSGWGGCIKDASGNLILDSVASNAAAHFLHNMMFVMGKDMSEAILPEKVSAQLLRANNIESYDTSVIHMETKDGLKMMFYASHATDEALNPIFDFKFEKATVSYRAGEGVKATFNDDTVKEYGEPLDDGIKRLWDAIDSIKTGTKLPCVAKTALNHNIIINSLYENCNIYNFPKEMLVEDDVNKKTMVDGLYENMIKSYKKGTMLENYPFAKAESFTVDKKYF